MDYNKAIILKFKMRKMIDYELKDPIESAKLHSLKERVFATNQYKPLSQ